VTFPGTVLVYPVRATDKWWKHIGDNLGFEKSVVVSDVRGAGDIDIVDDFYREIRRQKTDPGSRLLDEAQVTDVIARCRMLRWLPRRRAEAMIHAMAIVFDNVLDRTRPVALVAFPIDRYVSDVLYRLAQARGIPCLELTASLVSGQTMILLRGHLMQVAEAPPDALVEEYIREIANPSFTPSYAQVKSKYTLRRFFRIFFHFKLRGLVFWLISIVQRDPLNLHYLDAQSFLAHKPRLADCKVLGMVDPAWRDRLASFPREKRIFFALQLFPEASIDYFLDHVEMIDYEDLMVEAAQAFSAAGYLILIKDHPMQFGFRQRQLLQRLLKLPGAVFLPYDVNANEILAVSGANFTLTGTLGLQAALQGLKSVTPVTYYTVPGDFVNFERRSEIPDLPARVAAAPACTDLHARQKRIIANLLRGGFPGDIFTFKKFDPANPPPAARVLARNFGMRIRELIAQGRGRLS
jgi:hypothetical protein